MKYDYFIAGRWRNHIAIRSVLKKIRESGKTAYCFIENSYKGDNIDLDAGSQDVEGFMQELETLSDWQQNPTFRKIFENDLDGLKDSENFILVFPAGLSAHMELGVAYGLGKKCFAIGKPEKHETLYLMLDKIYPSVDKFIGDNESAVNES